MKMLSFVGTVAAALCCAVFVGCDEALVVGEGGLTPAEALSRLRAQRAAGEVGRKDIVIRGRVWLSSPIVLSAVDGDLTIHGEDGAILSGGLAITGWTDHGGGVWGAKLPVDAEGRLVYTESLFVNGRRAQRARYPADGGFFHVESVSQAVCSASVTTNRVFVNMRETDPAMRLLAATPPDELAYAQLLTHVKWDVARNPITAVANGQIVVDASPMKLWNVWCGGDFYALENVRAAFVAPGQWFYDAKAGEVLYRPLVGEEIREAIVPRAGLETLVAIDGATNVVFEGVAFAHSAPTDDCGPTRLAPWQAAAGVSKAAVVVDRSAGIEFRNCRFEHLGGYAVWFREGCRGGGAFACEMTDLGAGGVRIGALRRLRAEEAKARTDVDMKVPYVETAPWMTSHIAVEDCEIAHGGRFHPAGVGVFLTHASDCSIVHNDIFDLYYTGVSVGWVWGYSGSPSQRNVVAFNHIHDIGQGKLADMGGVYTLGTSFGTCVSNNVIHAIRSYSYGGWGLYTDEGSEGVVMENNLVYDTNCESYHQHYGRDNVIRNNIFAYSGEPRAAIAITRGEPHRSIVFKNNIVLFNRPAAIRTGVDAQADWKGNCWWRVGGKPFKMLNDLDFGAWRELGNDKEGAVADPKFRDPENRDFTLAPDSPALACGFRPFDVSTAGRRRSQIPH